LTIMLQQGVISPMVSAPHRLQMLCLNVINTEMLESHRKLGKMNKKLQSEMHTKA
jgi:hypothetical protein